MSVSRLMTYGVYALGALMVILGLSFVSAGVPIVRMELGWAEIISGAVAASAGCVVVVLGLLLSHLEGVQATLDRLLAVDSRAAFDDPLPFRPTLSEPFEAEAPAVPPPPETPPLRPVHPLAPAARRDPLPSPLAEVRPEPGLTAALHPADDEEIGPPPTAPAEPSRFEEPALDEGAPALVHAEQDQASHSPPVAAPDPVADPIADAPPPRPRPGFLASMLTRRVPAVAERVRAPTLPLRAPAAPIIAPIQASEPAPRTIVDLSSGWNDEPAAPPPAPEEHRPVEPLSEAAITPSERTDILDLGAQPQSAGEAPPAVSAEQSSPEPEPEPAPAPPAPPDPLTPVVVGRYNAGTASYVMYSNGMIEVETEHGTHQFASMQDLKAFIERRDARAS